MYGKILKLVERYEKLAADADRSEDFYLASYFRARLDGIHSVMNIIQEEKQNENISDLREESRRDF